MGSLQAVAATSDRPLTDQTRRSLDLALRYFREAAPKHTADEEDSLFPRLRRIKSPELEAALQKLDTLEVDHRWAEPLHATVEQLGLAYLGAGSLSAGDSTCFRDAVERLATMYRRHIEVEDREVFPIAARLLPKHEQEAIAREMAARRNVSPVVSIE